MAERDFKVVHRKDSLDQTRHFLPLYLKVSGKCPSELGEHDRIDDTGLVRRRGVDKATRSVALRRIVFDE